MDSALLAVDTSNTPRVPAAASNQWRAWDDRDFYTPLEGVARDAILGNAVANGAAPTFRFWQNRRSLAVSRQDLQLPNFASAAAQMNAAGWPVVARESGGSAIPLGPGILNISLVMPRSLVAATPGYGMDTVYHLLCEPIRQALASIELPTEFGSVPGAFCDGRFNLVAAGKKIAGTAQVWRANVAERGAAKEGYVLAHAVLFVDIDPYLITETVNRFYRLAGRAARYSANDITSVRHAIACNQTRKHFADSNTLADRLRARMVSVVEHPARQAIRSVQYS